MVVRVIKKPKQPKGPTKDVFTMRLDVELMTALDGVAKQHGVTRTKLVEHVLKRALSDKNFTIEIETDDEG